MKKPHKGNNEMESTFFYEYFDEKLNHECFIR